MLSAAQFLFEQTARQRADTVPRNGVRTDAGKHGDLAAENGIQRPNDPFLILFFIRRIGYENEIFQFFDSFVIIL